MVLAETSSCVINVEIKNNNNLFMLGLFAFRDYCELFGAHLVVKFYYNENETKDSFSL